jgi:hypothetical protein
VVIIWFSVLNFSTLPIATFGRSTNYGLFEIHPHIPWQQDHLNEFRELRAATFLNLSLCYLKLHQRMPAANAATEAMMGPNQEVYQYVDMLTPTQKIKAVCRRAQACF